jgi:ESCRT-II complex subunit VPS25
MNTILTFYEITDPPVESPLSGIPVALLRRAIVVLTKTGRAQIIGVADGEGVRLFPGSGK